MAVAGDYILLEYDVPGATLHHERLVTAVSPTTAGLYAVVTPDNDHYAESCILSNNDLRSVHWIGTQGTTPVGVNSNEVYRFTDPPTRRQLTQLFRDGALIVGAAPPAAALVAAPVGVAGGVAGGVPRAAVAGGAASSRQGRGARSVWVAAEDAGEYHKGDIIDELPDNVHIDGDRALMVDEDGQSLFIKNMLRSEIPNFVNEDLRVLTVRFDASGSRRRPFADAADALMNDEPEGGIGLEGPRSNYWLMRNWREMGLSPSTHHERWLRSSRIPDGDRSVHEHEVICRTLESMVAVDQLNTPALQSAELLSRRLQLIEDAHRLAPSNPDYSGADHFMGWQQRRGGAAVDPALQRHVAGQLRDEAAIAKESRKAKEEAKLRRANPNKKNKERDKEGE